MEAARRRMNREKCAEASVPANLLPPGAKRRRKRGHSDSRHYTACSPQGFECLLMATVHGPCSFFFVMNSAPFHTMLPFFLRFFSSTDFHQCLLSHFLMLLLSLPTTEKCSCPLGVSPQPTSLFSHILSMQSCGCTWFYQ